MQSRERVVVLVNAILLQIQRELRDHVVNAAASELLGKQVVPVKSSGPPGGVAAGGANLSSSPSVSGEEQNAKSDLPGPQDKGQERHQDKDAIKPKEDADGTGGSGSDHEDDDENEYLSDITEPDVMESTLSLARTF
eukprot:GSA25T00014435001.1